MGLFGRFSQEDIREALQPSLDVNDKLLVTWYAHDGVTLGISTKRGGKSWFVGSASLMTVSGPVVASVDLHVAEKFRGQGYAHLFERLKVQVCNMVGAELMVATVAKDNKVEIAAITGHGWVRMASLGNVDLWGKILKEPATYLTFLERLS